MDVPFECYYNLSVSTVSGCHITKATLNVYVYIRPRAAPGTIVSKLDTAAVQTRHN